jgi:hypothetical protein
LYKDTSCTNLNALTLRARSAIVRGGLLGFDQVDQHVLKLRKALVQTDDQKQYNCYSGRLPDHGPDQFIHIYLPPDYRKIHF